MNREIKFRAWDKVSKLWTNPNLMMNMAGRLTTDHSEDFVLSQYTGLKDKNGKEIYEGDWVRAGGTQFTVIWHELGASFRYYDGVQTESLMNYDDSEVIGNIYENPSPN